MSITQQLELQKILYECQGNEIIVQNQEQVYLDLQLIDQNVSSSLQITNIDFVQISNLVLSNIDNVFQRQLINFRQIENLNIKNLVISRLKNLEDFLISTFQINELVLGQVMINSVQSKYLLQLQSNNLTISQVTFENSDICFSSFEGTNKLSINNIQILINNLFFQFQECDRELTFTSQSKIITQNIDILVDNYRQSMLDYSKSYNFVHFYLIKNDVENRRIDIDRIYYKSSESSYQKGVIKLGTQSSTLKFVFVKQITFEQHNSKSFIQLLITNFEMCSINELNIVGFKASDSLKERESLIKFQNVNLFQIDQLTANQTAEIDGQIVQGYFGKQFTISHILMISQYIQSSIINLLSIQNVNIDYVDISDNHFEDYFIQVNQVQYFSLYSFKGEKCLIMQKSLFNLQNINRGVFQIIQLSKMNTNISYNIAIFQIELDTNFTQNSISFTQVEADLFSNNNIQFSIVYGSEYIFEMTNSQISNGSSKNFGGCLNFANSFKVVAYILNTTFKRCKSKFLGGAVSGIQNIDLFNVNFIECSSQIGGAIYILTNKSPNLPEKYFSQNIGYLAANNFNRDKLQLSILSILEINQSSNNITDLFLQTDGYLYPGLTYIFRLQISVDGEDYKTFADKNFFGNFYEFLQQPSRDFLSSTLPLLSSISFPYLLWCAQDISFKEELTKSLGNIQINFGELDELNTSQYKIYNGCKDQGMEKIYYQNNLQFICKYCEKMQVSQNGVCKNCPFNYFSDCYGNYSVLKQFYWRSHNSVDSKDIYFCSSNPQNCIGGIGIGNELCYEGHIGPQCLACDIYGSYWGERYSMIGSFQCVKCSSISLNTVKITKKLNLCFLSKQNGYILYRKDTFVKIPHFNLHQDFAISYSSSEYTSIGFLDLLITLMIPILICSTTIFVSIVVYFLNKRLFRRSLYASLLTLIYIFIIAFYSMLLEKSLSSFFCLDLDTNKSYSLIDLSLECGNSSELFKTQILRKNYILMGISTLINNENQKLLNNKKVIENYFILVGDISGSLIICDIKIKNINQIMVQKLHKVCRKQY
ncbi:hypothetical protein ABPG73_006780 [Tetrahymena malaccensis]